MNEYKVIFEASETSIGNWPSHCLTAENLQAACEEAHNLIPPVGARVLKVLVDGFVRQRFALGLQ